MKKMFLRSFGWVRLVRRLPHLRHFVQLLWRLVRDRRVPMYLKGMLGVSILYVLSPFDLIPESVLLMFGLFDDIAILMMGINWFLRLAPQEAVEAHLRTMSPGFQQSFQQWRRDQQLSSQT
jgi:uncharacterized membrane protein YkvA (DUF1232 family)